MSSDPVLMLVRFLLYREMETAAMQVVYRREAEGYGILVPVMRD